MYTIYNNLQHDHLQEEKTSWMGRPSQKKTLRLSDKVKISTCMIVKLVKMKKKDAYLYGIATACINPIQCELIQFIAYIYPLFMTSKFT